MYANFLLMNTRSSWRALCAGRSITFMTGVNLKLIITPPRFVTQFIPAELKIVVSYTVLKIIRVYEAILIVVV
jgi:hypothetical protein